MLSGLLPLPLGCQNIPDGCIIPCYPRNIKFPAQNPADSRPTCPTVSAITRPSHLALFISIYRCPQPRPTVLPIPPSHPAPSAGKPTYLLTQRTQLVSLTNHGTMARPCFSLFFGW